MRAFVLRGGRGRLEERPEPEPGPLDVVVKTTLMSACSADLACIRGDFPTPGGTVLGHEAVGVVHATGSLTTRFDVGQRVTAASTTPCGTCTNCQRGFGGHCGMTPWGGYSFGVSRDGTLAEYFVVPYADLNLVHIPATVSDEAALCVADTIASGSTGVEAARIPLGGVVVVIGQGHIGLAAIATARSDGAARVIAVKARSGGDDLARAMGADYCLSLAEHDVPAEVRDLTRGAGADVVVEASGATSAFPLAIELARDGGVIAVLSSYEGPPDATLFIPLAQWGWGIGDKTILSTFQQSGRERMSRLLDLVESGRMDPTPLLTRQYTFDDMDSVIGDLAARPPGHVKPLVRFD